MNIFRNQINLIHHQMLLFYSRLSSSSATSFSIFQHGPFFLLCSCSLNLDLSLFMMSQHALILHCCFEFSPLSLFFLFSFLEHYSKDQEDAGLEEVVEGEACYSSCFYEETHNIASLLLQLVLSFFGVLYWDFVQLNF